MTVNEFIEKLKVADPSGQRQIKVHEYISSCCSGCNDDYCEGHDPGYVEPDIESWPADAIHIVGY